jgi:hypothetical protein
MNQSLAPQQVDIQWWFVGLLECQMCLFGWNQFDVPRAFAMFPSLDRYGSLLFQCYTAHSNVKEAFANGRREVSEQCTVRCFHEYRSRSFRSTYVPIMWSRLQDGDRHE